MQPINRALDAMLNIAFDVDIERWTCEQIAAELRKLGWRKVFWGWDNGAFARVERYPGGDCHALHCDDESIPELERPRHALGRLALELKGKA